MECNSCGKEVTDTNQQFCDSCGARLNGEVSSPAQPTQQPQQPQPLQYASAPQPKIENTKQLIFSIISIVLCGCTGIIFGIIGLVFALTAKNEPTPELQQKKLKTSMTLSIIGLVTGAIFYIIYLAVVIFGGILSSI